MGGGGIVQTHIQVGTAQFIDQRHCCRENTDQPTDKIKKVDLALYWFPMPYELV